VPEVLEIGPQEIENGQHPQQRAMACGADILFYGGEAGGGKTTVLILEPIRHADNPLFTAVCFRRTQPQLRNPGGLWSETLKFYRPYGATPNETRLEWRFPSGALLKLGAVQYDADVADWHGSQICLLEFDQVEQFSAHQFFMLLSRNRSTCGVKPYVRCSCNPDADSWVAGFLAWWIGDDGYPVPARDGVWRWFIRLNDDIVWADSWEELFQRYPDLVATPGVRDEIGKLIPLSVTFIAASVYDNTILLRQNPEYLANLMALTTVERERLLGKPGRRGGNWKIRPAAGLIFNTAHFTVLDYYPTDIVSKVRYWDKAGTAAQDTTSKRAHTAGVLLGKRRNGKYVVLDVQRGQWSAWDRERNILETAVSDGKGVPIWVEQEPGSGGKESAEATVRMLAGWEIRIDRVTDPKSVRANAWASQTQAGNVEAVRGPWLRAYLDEHHAFDPSSTTSPKDQVDASSGAFLKLSAAVPWQTNKVVTA
jgi:predicted phage terminase large subunit-like protein